MKKVSIDEAKLNLASLIEDACRGEEVVITRGKVSLVKLVPVTRNRIRRRTVGILKDKLVVGKKFFDPLSPEELDRWE